LVAGLPPVEAVGISLFCVIGTSVGAASSALKHGQANLGLALSLEPVLVLSSVAGSLAAQRMGGGLLLGLFALMMLGISALFFRLWHSGQPLPPVAPSWPPLLVVASVPEPGGAEPLRCRPQRRGLVALLMGLTGASSGLFGIGGGAVNVPLLSVL